MNNGFEIPEIVVQILGFGFIGLSFLFAFFVFNLLKSESKKASPNKNMLIAIYIFMGLIIILSLMSIWSKFIDSNNKIKNLTEENKTLKEQLALIKTDKWTIHGYINEKYSRIKDPKLFFLPPEYTLTTFKANDRTEFWIKDLSICARTEFPSIGFQTDIYQSRELYKIKKNYDDVSDDKFLVNLKDPIILILK